MSLQGLAYTPSLCAARLCPRPISLQVLTGSRPTPGTQRPCWWQCDVPSPATTCRELAETILDSGDTLLTILGDILDFSKIDHNSMTLEAEPLDLRTTVEAVIEMVAADAVRKGIEIAYSLDEPLLHCLVMGDAIRIRQVRLPSLP